MEDLAELDIIFVYSNLSLTPLITNDRYLPVADLRGARGTPRGPKFFQFHAVFGKIWQNRMLAPPGELAPPPRGNPGSATVY